MAKERRFPCPECGQEFHFKADEVRLTVPCGKCGKLLVMPHFRMEAQNVTIGVSIGGDTSGTHQQVLGRSSGWSTPDECEKVMRANAIYMIEQWERIRAIPSSPPDVVKKAMNDAMSAFWPKKTFTHNGKKYTKISNSKRHELVVTEIPIKSINPSENRS
jgi:uncharacterized Zn finger protein